MSAAEDWESRLAALGSAERDTLLGTSLSRRFTRLPLWLSHPANIGGFYGLLISLALFLPYYFALPTSGVMMWVLHGSLLISACMILGLASTIIIAISKRLPVAPPRSILYPMPFLGLGLMSVDLTGIMDLPTWLIWTLIMIPGPLYVHLSWAPRWRLLCKLEDGVDPFDGLPEVEDEPTVAEDLCGDDEEMLDVIDNFDSEE